MHVCASEAPPYSVCLLRLFWDGGRCGVCSYTGEGARAKEGENHEPCKR